MLNFFTLKLHLFKKIIGNLYNIFCVKQSLSFCQNIYNILHCTYYVYRTKMILKLNIYLYNNHSFIYL